MWAKPNIIHRAIYTVTLLFVALFLGACGASDAELTLIADHQLTGTSMADVRTTATVAFLRVRTTIQHVETEIGREQRQQNLLVATLNARGTDVSFIERSIAELGRIELPTPTPPPTVLRINTSPMPTTSRLSNQQRTSEPTQSIGTPLSELLTDIQFAVTVGRDDCADEARSEFYVTDSEIYIIATAQGIPPGTSIGSRWRDRGGREFAYFEFTTDRYLNGSCIWFYIDQTDAIFTPGRWSVTLDINGVPIGSPIPFPIVE